VVHFHYIQNGKKRLGVVAHACNPSYWDAVGGGSLEFEANLEKINEDLSQKQKNWECSSSGRGLS
jgi:hypothetical protein